jgi:Glu-tRNA(Gln) amidotransferase subunit E-like FAD-binding protein
MTSDDIIKTVFGTLLAGLAGVVGWLFTKVIRNGTFGAEANVRLAALETAVKEIKDSELTRDDVREVVDAALDRRDADAAERRKQWDKLLTLELSKAVKEGVEECQVETKKHLETIVPLIVRETIQQTRRHRGSHPSEEGET